MSQRVDSVDRTLAAWEVVSLVSSVLIAEWLVFSVGGDGRWLVLAPVTMVFVFTFLSHRARGETAREIGFRTDNFLRALRLLALPTLLPATFLIAFGWYAGSLNFTRWSGGQSILGVPALGIFWGLMQQYALQGFVNRRAQIIWGRGWQSVLLTALVFGALHLPNPWLTLATFCGGLVWASVYQSAPNLYALGLSHALMTWVLISTIPPAALHNLRVGYKFFG